MLYWTDSQLNGISSGVVCLAIYMVATLLPHSKNLKYCFLAYCAAETYALSPLYNIASSISYSITYIIYSSIYFYIIRHLTDYKTAVSCFIMGSFEIISYKAYLNGLGHYKLEIYLYDNYEVLVSLVHVLICISVVQWSKLRANYWAFRNNILRSTMRLRCTLYC